VYAQVPLVSSNEKEGEDDNTKQEDSDEEEDDYSEDEENDAGSGDDSEDENGQKTGEGDFSPYADEKEDSKEVQQSSSVGR
jgi:hypothetical protein